MKLEESKKRYKRRERLRDITELTYVMTIFTIVYLCIVFGFEFMGVL